MPQNVGQNKTAPKKKASAGKPARKAKMGLDVSHDCWHGAYSAFMRFRKKICEVAGYGDINLREGFSEDATAVPWPDPKTDPLILFLHHSDCDGEIKHKDCGKIAERFCELLPALIRAGDGQGHIGQYADAAQRWINGLKLAAEKKENVIFG